MLSSVTYKSEPVKSDFGLEFSNSVSKVNINKRGCVGPSTILVASAWITVENVNLVSFNSAFPYSDR